MIFEVSAALALIGTMTAMLIVVMVVTKYNKHKKNSTVDDAGRIFHETSTYKSLPGPRGFPIVGSSPLVGKYDKPWEGFSALRKIYGDVYGITLGSRRCVVVSSIEAIKEVLLTRSNDYANRPDFLRFHAIFRGNRNVSVALCDWSDKQHVRRSLTFPFMHPKMRTFDEDRMGRIIEQEFSYMTNSFASEVEVAVKPRRKIMLTAANIFYSFMCSTRYSLDDRIFTDAVLYYDVVLKELFTGFAIDFMPWLKPFHKDKLDKLKGYSEYISQMTTPIFEQHVKELDPEHPRDLIDVLLIHLNDEKAENRLTMEEAEIIIDDLIGGHSAMGNMMDWTLFLLAENPSVRQKIRAEVKVATGNNSRRPQIQDRPELKYTEAAVLEILRVVASPIIPHVSTTDTSVQGYAVATNTMVIFNTFDCNMDPKLWDEPRKFKPERFLSDDGTVKKPDHFLPFGTGKRCCVGDRIVRASLVLLISTLLQNLDMSVPEGAYKPDMYSIPAMVIPQQDISIVFRKLD